MKDCYSSGGRTRAENIVKGYAKGGAVHDDAAQDKAMIRSMVKPGAMKLRDGGNIEGATSKSRGDRKMRGMKGGAGGALGRLEKSKMY